MCYIQFLKVNEHNNIPVVFIDFNHINKTSPDYMDYMDCDVCDFWHDYSQITVNSFSKQHSYLQKQKSWAFFEDP